LGREALEQIQQQQAAAAELAAASLRLITYQSHLTLAITTSRQVVKQEHQQQIHGSTKPALTADHLRQLAV
jgi:hypothetical protein